MTKILFKHVRLPVVMSALTVILLAGQASAQQPGDLPRPIYTDAAAYQPDGPKADPSDVGDGGDECVNGCDSGGLGLCKELCDPWRLAGAFDEDAPFTIGGWFQFGYHTKNNGVFNTHPNHVDLQQGWLYLERVADGSEGLDFGGRIDIVYGTDGANTQAFGNNPGRWDFANGFDYGVYGWAIPQMYGEVAWGKTSVKIGHFYTLLGYEVVTAPNNFFYSHAFTMNFSEAFTHTGVLATYAASDEVTVYGGWTLGWDTGFDRFNNGSNFLGGASVKIGDDMTVTYITTVGNFGAIQEGYSHSIVADWHFADKWNYVVQSDFIDTNAGFDTFGINQYLFYTVCDNVRAGTRLEWWKADGTSYHEWTVGLNYKPIANVVVRPEFRYQWSPGGNSNNAFGIPVSQGIFAVDTILTF